MTIRAPGHPSPAAKVPFTVLIPARMASSRLPNKPLADIAGIPMVVRVAQQALQSAAAEVVVAADDQRILDACKAFDIRAVATDAHHPSGSDRLAQACALLGLDEDSIVVNVQGDEPLIEPGLIDAVAQTLALQPGASMGTAAHPIDRTEDLHNPNVVKVVLNAQGMAQYFSRAPIPCARDYPGRAWWQGELQRSAPQVAELTAFSPLRHIGIYSYRAHFLKAFPQLMQAPTEVAEALEQLRALWHGHTIAVHVTLTPPAAGVDTPEDLERVRVLVQSAARR